MKLNHFYSCFSYSTLGLQVYIARFRFASSRSYPSDIFLVKQTEKPAFRLFFKECIPRVFRMMSFLLQYAVFKVQYIGTEVSLKFLSEMFLQPPALPYRRQYSTIGRLWLNRRVRHGNGCFP